MLISYFIYGRLDYWRGKGERFNQTMRRNLNLNGGAAFRKSETIFQGLSFTSAVNVEDGQLCYIGKLLINEYVSNMITCEENQGRVNNCMEILENVASGIDSIQQQREAYGALSEILWEEICSFSKSKFGRQLDLLAANRLCSFIASKPIRAISILQFLLHILESSSLEQQVIQRVVQAVRCITGSTEDLKERLGDQIEEMMWETGDCLLYPSGQKGVTFVVMPPIGRGSEKMSTAPREFREKIALQYQRACYKTHRDLDIPISRVCELLSSMEDFRWMDKPCIVKGFFQRMLFEDAVDEVKE